METEPMTAIERRLASVWTKVLHIGSSRRRLTWRAALDVVTSVVLIGAAVTLVSLHLSNRARAARPEPKIPEDPISIDKAASKGSQSAPVVMIVFSDFQCPFCGRFARDVLPDLERDYIATGRVLLAFRHLPLQNHQYATGAAQAAECAGGQDRFWPMHDRLFGETEQLDGTNLRRLAASMDLDVPAFEACLDKEEYVLAVSRDTEQAKRLGLVSTPSFLLGSRLADGRVRVSRAFSGALPLERFRQELDRAMKPGTGVSLWGRLFSLIAFGATVRA